MQAVAKPAAAFRPQSSLLCCCVEDGRIALTGSQRIWDLVMAVTSLLPCVPWMSHITYPTQFTYFNTALSLSLS